MLLYHATFSVDRGGSFFILPGSDAQASDFYLFCKADVESTPCSFKVQNGAASAEGGSQALGLAQDFPQYFLHCSPIRETAGICQRPSERGLRMTISAHSLEMISLCTGLCWGKPRVLRVSGFLFLADLDFYLACYQVYPTALWVRRDCFPAQVVGNLVLSTSHQLLRTSFCRTETAFILLQRASDIWQIQKKNHHLKFIFSLGFISFKVCLPVPVVCEAIGKNCLNISLFLWSHLLHTCISDHSTWWF